MVNKQAVEVVTRVNGVRGKKREQVKNRKLENRIVKDWIGSEMDKWLNGKSEQVQKRLNERMLYDGMEYDGKSEQVQKWLNERMI